MEDRCLEYRDGIGNFIQLDRGVDLWCFLAKGNTPKQSFVFCCIPAWDAEAGCYYQFVIVLKIPLLAGLSDNEKQPRKLLINWQNFSDFRSYSASIS